MPVRTPSPTVLARLAGLVLRAAQAHGADTARLLAGLDVAVDRLDDQVRQALALQYVGDRHLALGEVAYLLGYSEPSVFHRAFRCWTGSTLAAARRHAN